MKKRFSWFPVLVKGSADGPIPISANAGGDQTVLMDSVATLNGTNSTGSITSFSWTQLSGTPLTLLEANTATPTLTAPNTPVTLVFELAVEGIGGLSTATFTFPTQPTTLTFQLTVSGPGGASSATVQVASLIETLTVSRAEYRTGDLEWRISGLSNLVGQKFLFPSILEVRLQVIYSRRYQLMHLEIGNTESKGSTEKPNETRSISIQSSSGEVS